MNKRVVIFDLDGTLLNTIGDLAASCNTVLTRHGLPTHSYATYQTFVGNGVMRLVERAIPEERRSEEFVAAVRKDFVEYYQANIEKHTQIYSGITELLNELESRNVEIAVASNKFQEGTYKLVRHFFPDIKFLTILGQRPNIPLKPDPYILNDIISQTNYALDEVLYVGDSGIDMETAKAANVESVGVTWGFRPRQELVDSGAKYIVDKAEDILSFL